MSTAVAVGHTHTQERSENLVAESLNVASVGADGCKMKSELTPVQPTIALSTVTAATEPQYTVWRARTMKHCSHQATPSITK